MGTLNKCYCTSFDPANKEIFKTILHDNDYNICFSKNDAYRGCIQYFPVTQMKTPHRALIGTKFTEKPNCP